jgi:hypothetical protein
MASARRAKEARPAVASRPRFIRLTDFLCGKLQSQPKEGNVSETDLPKEIDRALNWGYPLFAEIIALWALSGFLQNGSLSLGLIANKRAA